MRRAIATLVVLVFAGAVSVEVSAQRARPSQPSRSGQTTRVSDGRQNPNCSELGQLRHELARLEQELRRLEDAFEQAKQAGNHARAAEILQQIRQVKAEIQQVQQKIRRLEQVCR